MQLNSNEVYRQSGSRAGAAAKNHDWSFVTHEQNWLHRALVREDEENRQAIRRMWNDAYKSKNAIRIFSSHWA